jgi:pyruvate decarboxylase
MSTAATDQQRTLGQHLGSHLASAGCRQFFAVPGDYTLALLDELAKEPALRPRWCCSELGAGYAADGAARAEGLGCVCVTYTVGGLSAINTVAGAYEERVPLVVLTGGPNSNDYASNKVLHHTIGLPGDFMQELEAYKAVTVDQVVLKDLSTARALIDRALGAALAHSRPVYISVACNLASLTHPSFAAPGAPFIPPPRRSDPGAVAAAAQAAADFLNAKTKPVLIAGPGLRSHPGAAEAFLTAADAAGAPFAYQPAAKGLVPEPGVHP